MKSNNFSIINFLISLVLALIMGFASYAIETLPQNGKPIFFSIIVAVMTFLVSEAFLTLMKHISIIHKYDTLSHLSELYSQGIVAYYNNYTNIDFKTEIKNTNNIKLILMYSRGFLNNQLQELRTFLASNKSNLEIILINDFIGDKGYSYLTSKYGFIDDKINGSIEAFKNLIIHDLLPHKHPESKVILYHTQYLPAYSLFMFDRTAFFTLYKTAPERTNLVPSFKVIDNPNQSLYNFFLNDFNEIKRHPTTISIDFDQFCITTTKTN